MSKSKFYVGAIIIIIAVIAVGGYALKRSQAAPFSGGSNLVNGKVKEFSIKSFTEFVDGKPKPQFDPNQIVVNKGDVVRLKVTVTKGVHNFNIDEYNIHQDTMLNQEATVEFTADKAGEFVYYCSMPGHRQAGHWGTLKVI